MTRDFFQVFAKNSIIKNIFQEEKKFDSGLEHDFFFWKVVPNWVYSGRGEDLKLTPQLSEKMQYSRNEAMEKQLKWSNTA